VTGAVDVCPYTAPCPGCGRDIPWTAVHRKIKIEISHIIQDITEARPGDCAYCDTADVRDQINGTLNRETA
jgi:hypothetical protein